MLTLLTPRFSTDQWSPVNTDGKRQYDRQFLMQLMSAPLSMEKPANLPQMEIIKDKQVSKNEIFCSFNLFLLSGTQPKNALIAPPFFFSSFVDRRKSRVAAGLW
jgi:hypothetical protein